MASLCNVFASSLDCYEWLTANLKLKFTFAKFDLKKDAKALIKLVKNYEHNNQLIEYKRNYPEFYEKLNFINIANKYLQIFEKIKNKF